MAYDASAAKSSHPALIVSPRARASIPQQRAPTRAMMTHIPYRRRPLFMTSPALPLRPYRSICILSYRKIVSNAQPAVRVVNDPARYTMIMLRTLRTLGEEPGGGEADGAC